MTSASPPPPPPSPPPPPPHRWGDDAEDEAEAGGGTGPAQPYVHVQPLRSATIALAQQQQQQQEQQQGHKRTRPGGRSGGGGGAVTFDTRDADRYHTARRNWQGLWGGDGGGVPPPPPSAAAAAEPGRQPQQQTWTVVTNDPRHMHSHQERTLWSPVSAPAGPWRTATTTGSAQKKQQQQGEKAPTTAPADRAGSSRAFQCSFCLRYVSMQQLRCCHPSADNRGVATTAFKSRSAVTVTAAGAAGAPPPPPPPPSEEETAAAARGLWLICRQCRGRSRAQWCVLHSDPRYVIKRDAFARQRVQDAAGWREPCPKCGVPLWATRSPASAYFEPAAPDSSILL